MIPDPAPPFELHSSEIARDSVRRLLRQAAELGLQSQVAEALTDIVEHLITDPRVWGDPLFRFHSLNMTQYGRTFAAFRCEYCVHDRIPTVVFTNVFPIPGNPLYDESAGK